MCRSDCGVRDALLCGVCDRGHAEVGVGVHRGHPRGCDLDLEALTTRVVAEEQRKLEDGTHRMDE